jgi:hypothetical protein
MTRPNGAPASACPKREQCEAAFSHISFAPSVGVLRALYCESRYEACERYKRLASGQAVPPTLLPDGRDHGAPARPAAPRRS